MNGEEKLAALDQFEHDEWLTFMSQYSDREYMYVALKNIERCQRIRANIKAGMPVPVIPSGPAVPFGSA